MRSLIIDNSLAPLFLREGALVRRFFREPVAVRSGIWHALPAPDSFDRLIITGSETSARNDRDWIKRQCELIVRAVESGKPVLGICFGHQLIARALWGKDKVRRAPMAEFGWRPVHLETRDPLFSGLPEKPTLYCSHFDEVTGLPDAAVLLARSEKCAVQAFRLAEKPVWGVQFHPEIGLGSGMLILFVFGTLLHKAPASLRREYWQAKPPLYAQTIFDNFRRMT